jgi:hypothetical protein
MELLVLVLAAGLLLWIVAIVDLINAREMEPGGRFILAAVVVFVPPLGLLLWLLVRQGRFGLVLATMLTVVGLVITISVLEAGSFHLNVGRTDTAPMMVRQAEQQGQLGP